MITDFLINMFNLLGRIIAALLGQGKAWQYVAGSTKQATAAAQDNLAAWDQINVLAKGQGEANAGAGKFIQVDVEEDLLKNTWTNIKNWLREHIVQPITDWFLDMWDIVVEYAGIAWGKVQEWWSGVETWWYENITVPIQNVFGAAWDYITIWARDIWVLIKFWFTEGVRGLGLIKDELVRVWNNAWEDVKKGAKLYYDKIMEYWIPFAEWFGNTVTKPVKNAWRAALNAIGSGFNAFSSGAAGVLTSFVNGIIGVVNRAVSVVIEFINKIAEALNKVGSVVPGWKTIPTVATPSFGGVVIPPLVKFAPLPELASGAVIPPNSRFAAVLGDQTSGMNIEAPETLIRQIISEEMGNIKAEITIDFAGTMGQFVRDLKPYITREDVRVGKNLVEGNIT